MPLTPLATFSGTVRHGDGYGHTLGYPTVNIDGDDYVRNNIRLAHGVYAGYVLVGEKRYKAGIVIGAVVHEGLPKLEAYLIGFNGNLYGKRLTFAVVHFLRSYRKFESTDDLIAQIGKDIEEVKKMLP